MQGDYSHYSFSLQPMNRRRRIRKRRWNPAPPEWLSSGKSGGEGKVGTKYTDVWLHVQTLLTMYSALQRSRSASVARNDGLLTQEEGAIVRMWKCGSVRNWTHLQPSKSAAVHAATGFSGNWLEIVKDAFNVHLKYPRNPAKITRNH